MDEQEIECPDLITPLVKRGWPPALAKATFDPFTYAIALRTGLVVVFEEAEIIGDGEWVTLRGVTEHSGFAEGPEFLFTFERGLEVRVADIVWAVDAPYGS